MLDSQLPASIKIAFSQQGPELKNGDIVSIQVIKRLTGTKWAIGVQGRVYPAQTDFELHPGQILRVKVFKKGLGLQFKLAPERADSRVLDFLRTNGIPGDTTTRQIVNALIGSRMAILPELVMKIRERVLKEKKPVPPLARFLINLHEKGMGGGSRELEPLLALLDYGSNQGNRREQQRKQPSPQETREALESVLSVSPGKEDNLLALFNHLGGEKESWIVIPYSVPGGSSFLRGTLRLLLAPGTGEIRKGALIVYSGDDAKWSFFINPDKKKIRVMVFSNQKMYIGKKSGSIKALASKLADMNVVIDDRIYNDDEFDGFFPLNELYGINAVDTII